MALSGAYATRATFTSAVVEILSGDAMVPTLIYKLENVLVDGFVPTFSSRNGRPLETFSIIFVKCGWARGAPPVVTDVVIGAVSLSRAVLRALTQL